MNARTAVESLSHDCPKSIPSTDTGKALIAVGEPNLDIEAELLNNYNDNNVLEI